MKIALTAVLALCLSVSVSAALQSTPDTAGNLQPNGSATGNMGDKDWWKVTTALNGSLTIETDSDETLFLYLYLYDRNMNVLDRSEFFENKHQHVEHMFLSPGEYYVKAVPKEQSSGAYAISSKFTHSLYENENDYDHEPNNIIKQAYPIKDETVYTGHLGYYDLGNYDTTDYYRYSVVGPRNIFIKAVGESSLDIDIVFIDACGCGGGDTEVSLETVGDHVWFFTYTRDCYLKITGKSNSYGSYAFMLTESQFSPPEFFTASLNDALVSHVYEQSINAVDLDIVDGITYTLLAGPRWLHIDENGILSGTPGIYDRGTNIPVVIKAADNHSKENILNTTIDVIFEIDPPEDFTVSDMPDDNGYRLELTWKLSDVERYLSHYTIYRSQFYEFINPLPLDSFDTIEDLITAEHSHAIQIGSVDAGVNTFIDTSIPQNDKLYFYWIMAVSDYGESEKISARYMPGITQVDSPPSAFRVQPPYPNPFNPLTTIRYEVPFACHVSLVVYDILGREAAVLHEGYVSTGMHDAVWDGRNTGGDRLGSGIYLYKITAGEHAAQGKVMLLR